MNNKTDKARERFKHLIYIGSCDTCCDSSGDNCKNCEDSALSELLAEINKHYILKEQ